MPLLRAVVSYLLPLLVVALGLHSGAKATQVTVTASGPLGQPTAGNVFTFPAGSRVNLSFTYDTESASIGTQGASLVYPATATFSFGSHTFSGAATIGVRGDGSSSRDSLLVQPQFASTGFLSLLGPDVTYTGPVDLSSIFFRTGGFSWFDTQWPAGTFPGSELTVLPLEDLGFNVQNSSYQLSTSGLDSERFPYTYDTVSITIGVPEPSSLALVTLMLGITAIRKQSSRA